MADPRRLLPAMLLLLAGCNLATGPTREFGKADGGGVALKPGLWTVTGCAPPAGDSQPCDVPHETARVTGALIERYPPSSRPNAPGVAMTIAFATGTPLLMELSPRDLPHGEQQEGFLFAAVEITARDDAGRVTEVHAWPIQCGPPPSPDAWNYGIFGEKGMTTDHPYPGLTMIGETCTENGLDAVRHAAIESRKAGTLTIRWMRDAP